MEADTHIHELLERFFNAESTNEEERELYAFFNQKNLPTSWQPYKPLFAFFESGMASEEAPKESVQAPASPRSRTLWRRGLLSGTIAIAASLVLWVCLHFGGTPWKQQGSNPYEGSYSIKNGVRANLSQEEAMQIYNRAMSVVDSKLRVEREARQIETHYSLLYKQQLEKADNVMRNYDE